MNRDLLDSLKDAIQEELCIGPLNTLEDRLYQRTLRFMIDAYKLGHEGAMDKAKTTVDHWLENIKNPPK